MDHLIVNFRRSYGGLKPQDVEILHMNDICIFAITSIEFIALDMHAFPNYGKWREQIFFSRSARGQQTCTPLTEPWRRAAPGGSFGSEFPAICNHCVVMAA